MSDEEWNNWSKIIRSVALSSKLPLTLYELNRDTKQIDGLDIPFRAFEYCSLEEMLRDINGLVVFQCRDTGKLVVRANASEETAHISKMIRAQKSDKKKPRTMLSARHRRPVTYRNPQQVGNRNGGYSSNNRYVPPTVRCNAPNQGYNQRSSPTIEMPKRPQSLNFQSSQPSSQRSTPRITPIQSFSPSTPSQRQTPTTPATTAAPRMTPTTPAGSSTTFKMPNPPPLATPATPINPSSPTMSSKTATPVTPSKPLTPSMKPVTLATTPQKPMTHVTTPQKPMTHVTTPQKPMTPTTMPGKSVTPVITPTKSVTTPITPVQQRSVAFTPTTESSISSQRPPSVQYRLQKAVASTMTPIAQTVSIAPTTPVTPSGPTTPRTSTYPNVTERLTTARSSTTTIPPSNDDSRLILLNYAKAKGLPEPQYKDIPTKSKDFFSCVTIGEKKYSSYPNEAPSKDYAEKIAANLALQNLLGKDKRPDVTTRDKSLIVRRIIEIVNDHPNGLLKSGLVEVYTEMYNEGLPHDWLKSVENFITVEPGANSTLILHPKKSNEIVELEPKKSNEIVKLELKKSKEIVEPEIIKINELNDDELYLHIYVTFSTTNIWGVIIDENHSDKFDELANEMRYFYNRDCSSTTPVTPGKYYAVFDSDWHHRVRCLEYDEQNDTATVFFIDRGDEDVFPASDLRTLHPQFCVLPAQAINISLAGLELFEDCNDVQPILEKRLLDKDPDRENIVLVRRVGNDHVIQNDTNVLSAHLYVNQENDEYTINVNNVLKDDILTIVNPLSCIAKDKVPREVYISEINEKSLFVQVKSDGLKLLQKLVNDVTNEFLNNAYFKPRPVLQFDTSKMYATKSAADNCWYRVKITNIENNDIALACCIDEGHTLTVQRTNLILLEDLSELLALYPPQAVQIKLHKVSPIEFNKIMANHLRILAPKSDSFLMKVVDLLTDLPVVEFYKRTEENLFASLNDTLILEREISSRDDNNNSRRIKSKRISLNSKADLPLQPPHVPSIGSHFDVHITMASHPNNFTVQPSDSAEKLEIMMRDLNRICENYNGPTLMSNNIEVGNMYAAKYEGDNRWYRGCVSKVISKNVCIVYYCDYGDFRAISMDQLQPLKEKFLQLPYQAIRAKLHGVAPLMGGDWSVNDSLRFIDLTVEKKFLSVIKSIDTDSITGDKVLDLDLIDSNTPENIHISSILINEKRAKQLEI